MICIKRSHQAPKKSHHGLLISRKHVLLSFALSWHLDEEDGVNVQRIVRLVVPSCKLGADVRGGDNLEAEVDCGCKELNKEASSVETRALVAPWTP